MKKKKGKFEIDAETKNSLISSMCYYAYILLSAFTIIIAIVASYILINHTIWFSKNADISNDILIIFKQYDKNNDNVLDILEFESIGYRLSKVEVH